MKRLINLKVFVNMKKNLFLVAMAAVAFAACSDDFAEAPPVVNPVSEEAFEKPIVFSSASNGGMTRANIGGAAAADSLGGEFVVSGYKGTKSKWADSSNPSIVFDNFQVVWEENTANTTESNTSNWEYVGKGVIKHATDKGITRQAIKYWDYTQPQYDFIAWSTGKRTAIYEGTPTDGQVLVSAITPNKAFGEYDEDATDASTNPIAYTFTGKAIDLSQCYIADLVTVKKDGTGTGNYGQPVTLTFRGLGTKVRIGLYETIPGYSVKNVEFYSAAASNDASPLGAMLFTTTGNKIYTEGTYTVYYPTVDTPSDADNNQAHIVFAPKTGVDQTTTVKWGALNYTIAEDAEKTEGAVFLGRTSNTATYAGGASSNFYLYYLPNETGTNLNLRVNYTLESIDGTGEEIVVRGATAQVPSIYAEWKPGFAYTYLFKISDKTNGHTGVYDPTQPDNTEVNSDPAGLYPITFDAVVVDSEENGKTQETITTVSTPSITTYQQNSTVVNDNEYQAANGDIYVTVNDGNEENTPDLAHGHLVTLKAYSATTPVDDMAALFTIPEGKTEADVVDAMQMQEDHPADDVTIQGRNNLELRAAPYTLTNTVKFGVDGNPIGVGDDQAMRFIPGAGTYAFVYTKKAPTTTTAEYGRVSKAKGESVAGLYRCALRSATGDVQKGVLYFRSLKKDAVTVFLGQTVNNLYLDDEGETIASGYAVTGTQYYYTTDHGMTYKAAHQVAYADFKSTTLYTLSGTTYTAKDESLATPEDGTAYYFKETDGSYTYCVIYPQQGNTPTKLYTQDETTKVEIDWANPKAVTGGIYFDRYNVNNGVYYAKVIKVE